MSWVTVILATMALGVIGSLAVSSAYKKWGKVQSAINMTGADMARQMLNAAGQEDVTINIVPGTLTDYFDPSNKTLNLSQDVAYGTSVAAHAVACHEAGHYEQYCEGYSMMRVRRALVPLTTVSSNLSWFLLLLGVLFQSLGMIYIAIACYAVSLVFSVVTLPVEFNASHRAVDFLGSYSSWVSQNYGVMVPASEMQGIKTMLKSAASTYVLSTLASIINLVYLISAFGQN